MGIPAFFRWLSKKYPTIVSPAERDHSVMSDRPFDNLYLDMNGIIHPCTHPEDKAAPETEEEMFQAIFEYIEMLMRMIRPRKLLYMAVDGVAPRAKMNQQRSRRFRASQEGLDKMNEVAAIKDKLKAVGVDVDSFGTRAHFDSNVITPGTQFMINLAAALKSWVDSKYAPGYVDKDGIWPRGMTVILSDASVPGEGEHKIMDYIRREKALDTYNPTLTHCLCGADADLIMLGLATHELNFHILREEFVPNQPRPCDICNQYGHMMAECEGLERDPDEDLILPVAPGFIMIHLPILRELLRTECLNYGADLDYERFIDDFVCLCFFVGNDFLPHLPSLEIREGAVDRLVRIYMDIMKNTNPREYLTENGMINLKQAQRILEQLGYQEDNIFQRRQQNEIRFREMNKRKKREKEQHDAEAKKSKWMGADAVVPRGQQPQQMGNARVEAMKARMVYGTDFSDSEVNPTAKRKREESDEDSAPEDNVQLGDDGWKERYYFRKFDAAVHTDISPSDRQRICSWSLLGPPILFPRMCRLAMVLPLSLCPFRQ